MTLFPLPAVPRRPRRALARCTDAGPLDVVVPGKTEMGRFVHGCGLDEWIPCTRTELRRGVECPECTPDRGTL